MRIRKFFMPVGLLLMTCAIAFARPPAVNAGGSVNHFTVAGVTRSAGLHITWTSGGDPEALVYTRNLNFK